MNFNDHHLCNACGRKFGEHAAARNPHCAVGTCPSGDFPSWPKMKDEAKAGALFDKRIAKFWTTSKTTFRPC